MGWKQKHQKLRERVFNSSDAKTLSAFDKQVERAAKGLTTEEALFVLADKYKVGYARDFSKLSSDSQQRVSSRIIQNVEINTTKNVKIDRRIVNLNNSIIQNLSVGDRSVVNQSAIVLGNELEELFSAIEVSKKLTQDEKADYKSDLEALASQIGKKKPNLNIIRAAWSSIEKLATIDGFADLILKIGPLILPLLGGHLHT